MGYLQMSRNVESIFGAVVTAPHQIPYTYTATGGETYISLPFYPVTGFITINGGVQVPVDNYEIDGNAVNLGRALEAGDVVYCLFDKVLSPEDYENGIRIYKFQAVGNETSFTPDFTTYGVQSLYVDGRFQVPGVNYSYNSTTGLLGFLTGSPSAGVWVVAEMSVKQPNISPAFDRTTQEIARSTNFKDDFIVLSTDTVSLLDNKLVIYDVVAQKSWGKPSSVPNGAKIVSVTGSTLVYNPGMVSVPLVSVPGSTEALSNVLSSFQGAGFIFTSAEESVQSFISSSVHVYPTVAAVQANTKIAVGATVRVMEYFAGVPYSGGEWTKTSEIATANKHPVDLQRLAFTDSQGYVYKFNETPMAGVNIEQIGGRPYNSADLPGCDLAPLFLSILNYKRTIPNNHLIINLPSREYYSSKGIPVYQWTTVRSVGKLGTQFRIAKGLWTDAQIPYVAMSGVNTFYSIKSFHVGIVHPTDAFASNVSIYGIDFVTNAGDYVDYGLYFPYYNDTSVGGVRNTGVDIALFYNNGYSSVFDRHLATARTTVSGGAGSWGVRCVERSAGVGCGTSVKFIECGYTDFILGWSLTGMTYTHIDTCYTEGTLSEVVGTFTNCTALVMTSYGIERLTSNRVAALVQISGGSVTINGMIAAFNVSANANIFLQASGSGKLTVTGLNMKYLTNGSTTGLITTADNVEAFISPVVYPDTGTYSNTLGINTYMLGTGGNVTPQTINSAAANFNSLTDPINTKGKFLGKGIFDRTLGCVVYASGATAASVWRDGAGTVRYTPV